MSERNVFARTVLAIACLVRAAAAGDGDWPMFIGDGDQTPPQRGQQLVDHLDDATVAWKLDHHLGVGKGLYPDQLTTARAHGLEAFYGGTATPIVADGTVFVTYFKPDGKTPARREGWRTMPDEKLDLLPKWFFSVTADDILVAVDAQTGKIRWEVVEQGKGLNRLGHKRGHWAVAPAYRNGRVFSMGTAGRLYAYDAQSGRKLWEVVAEPALQQLREKYLQEQRLCWEAAEKSCLVAVDDVIVAPHGGLTAFGVESGAVRWQIDEQVLSPWATPVFWQHQGKTYLVANEGSGTVRLIDPADGRILWTLDGLGQQLGTVTVTGDVALLNAGSPKSQDKKANGLFAAYELSLQGAKKLWSLPDDAKYRHSWTMDRGAERRTAIQDGNVYLVVGLDKDDRLVVADVKTGRIKAEYPGLRCLAPYPMEHRLLLYSDRAHTDPVTASWWSLDAPDRPALLHGTTGFGPRTITGYELPIEWPYVDGRLYARTLDGLMAFDLRRPADSPANQTLHLTLPAAVTGTGGNLNATLTQRDGKLTHGGFREARRLHSIDTSRARWDGQRLTGTLGIDVTGFQQFSDYEIDATLTEGARLTGTITSRLEAFRKPIPLSGKVTAMEHQDWWMPPADHVLSLPEAAIQQGGLRGRLLLYIAEKDGGLDRGGWHGRPYDQGLAGDRCQRPDNPGRPDLRHAQGAVSSRRMGSAAGRNGRHRRRGISRSTPNWAGPPPTRWVRTEALSAPRGRSAGPWRPRRNNLVDFKVVGTLRVP